MKRLTALVAVASLWAFAGPAIAAPPLQRLRGTIEQVGDGSITMKTINGKTDTVFLNGNTKVAYVVKSRLDAIKDGVFIGTATKGNNPPTALEVVVFPEQMRGAGEGHYAWDRIPDTLAGGTRVTSAMTNGTVTSSAVVSPRVQSAMTNGTVSETAGANGAKMLTVDYGNGQSLKVLVPPQAPVVSFEPADSSALQPGAKAFVVARDDNGKLVATRIAVGKDGLTPPM